MDCLSLFDFETTFTLAVFCFLSSLNLRTIFTVAERFVFRCLSLKRHLMLRKRIVFIGNNPGTNPETAFTVAILI